MFKQFCTNLAITIKFCVEFNSVGSLILLTANNKRSIRNVLSIMLRSKGTRSAGTVMISVLELLSRYRWELHEHESSCSSSLQMSSLYVSGILRIAGPNQGTRRTPWAGTTFSFQGLYSTGEQWMRGREGEPNMRIHNKRLCKKIMKSFNKTGSKLKNPGNFMIWWLVILSSTPGCIRLYICSVGPPGLGGGLPSPPPSTPLQEGAKGGHAQGDAHATQPPPYYAPGDRFVTIKNGRILEPSTQ